MSEELNYRLGVAAGLAKTTELLDGMEAAAVEEPEDAT